MRRFFIPKFVSVRNISVCTPLNAWNISGRRPILMRSQNDVILLNDSRVIDRADVWFKNDIPLLWRYHLHYFDDLNAVDAHKRESWHRHLIDRWIDENPPVCKPGWDSYPTSLRIVNWAQWALSGHALKPEWKDSLASQSEWLSHNLERDLLGNHLLANAKALIFSGIFFGGTKAGAWRKTGENILEEQLPVQILKDGGHYERSPMYHAIILEDILELIHLYQIFDLSVPPLLSNHVVPMLRWMSEMTHPDGGISFFNDATLGQARGSKYLHDLAEAIEYKHEKKREGTVKLLSESGYARVESRDAVLIADVGSLGPDVQPGHAHAGTLSFELSIKGQRIIVNSGISGYGLGKMREWQRSTAAHSTLELERSNSSVVWAGFRVAQRAKVVGAGVDEMSGTIWGEHDGYCRVNGLGTHRREWRISDNLLEITDTVQGSHRSNIRLIYHLHPLIKDVSIVNGNHVQLIHPGVGMVMLQLPDALKIDIDFGRYFPGFGENEANYRVVSTGKQVLPIGLNTYIKWG